MSFILIKFDVCVCACLCVRVQFYERRKRKKKNHNKTTNQRSLEISPHHTKERRTNELTVHTSDLVQCSNQTVWSICPLRWLGFASFGFIWFGFQVRRIHTTLSYTLGLYAALFPFCWMFHVLLIFLYIATGDAAAAALWCWCCCSLSTFVCICLQAKVLAVRLFTLLIPFGSHALTDEHHYAHIADNYSLFIDTNTHTLDVWTKCVWHTATLSLPLLSHLPLSAKNSHSHGDTKKKPSHMRPPKSVCVCVCVLTSAYVSLNEHRIWHAFTNQVS